MEFAIFSPGCSVWMWTRTLKNPVQVTVADVSIWVNDRGTTISYSFEPHPEDSSFGRTYSETVFATEAEALVYQRKDIEKLRGRYYPRSDLRYNRCDSRRLFGTWLLLIQEIVKTPGEIMRLIFRKPFQ